jgi:hypothetical protein
MQQAGDCSKLVYDNFLKIIRKAPTLIGAANVGKYPLTASWGRRYFWLSHPLAPSRGKRTDR